MKRLAAVTTIIAYIIFAGNSMVYANQKVFVDEENIIKSENSGNFCEFLEKNDNEKIEELMDENLMHKTGVINEENEEILNRGGILDEEIEELPQEAQEILQEECYQLCTAVNYYSFDEDGNRSEATFDEIEEYFEEEQSADEKKGIFGSNQINAKAKSLLDSHLSQSDMLRESICLMQTVKNGPVYVTYNGSWLKLPESRYHDIAIVTVNNLTPIGNTVVCRYYYDLTQSYFLGSEMKHDQIKGYKNLIYDLTTEGVAAQFDFYTTREQDAIYAGGGTYNNYNSNRVYIFFQATRRLDSQKYCSAYGNYYHQLKNVSIKPSVAINKNGASISLSPSVEKYYYHVITNTYIGQFYFK